MIINLSNNLQYKFLYTIKYNFKYIIIPYTKLFYTIFMKLYQENYIKNFSIITNNIKLYKKYFLIEHVIINNKIKLRYINFFYKKQYYTYKKLKLLFKMNDKSHLFLISTSNGVKTLTESIDCKLGGLLLLYCY